MQATTTFSLEGVSNFFTEKFCKFDCDFSLAKNTNENTDNLIEILGFKAKYLRIQEKIDQFIKLGAKGVDLMSALSPKNTGEQSIFYQIGRVDFIVRVPSIMGNIEFLSEMKGKIFFREIALATFRSGGKSMYEISYNWENAAGLHGLSLLEFIQNPKDFMAKRF